MGVAQHHDAVSGTEKQEVAFDYAQRLSEGIDVAQVSETISFECYCLFCEQVGMFLNLYICILLRSYEFLSLFRLSSIKLMPNFYPKIANHHHQLSFSVNYQTSVNV